MRARRTALMLTAAAGLAVAVVAARRVGRPPQPPVRTGTFSHGIEWAAVGNGPRTLLFLPGGPGSAAFTGIGARIGTGIFRPLAAAGFTVWRLSRRRNMPPGHSVADMADDVAHVINNEGFGGHVDAVVGLSYGGTIALLLAARHPDAVGRVALVASSAAITDEGRATDWRYGQALGHGRFTEAAQALLEELAPGDRLRSLRRLLAPVLGRLLATSGYNLPDVLVETQAEMDVDARPVLHQITAPVLIIAGDQDVFFTPEIVDETTRLIPDCTVVRYQGRGHGGTASDKRVPGDVLAFLDR